MNAPRIPLALSHEHREVVVSPKQIAVFRELDRDECEAILDGNRLGRIAFSFHDRVDIQPIHYVRQGEWLYARTSPGTKIMTLAHNPWVAFEVDEVDGILDWRSVVVHGTVHVLDPEGTGAEQRAYVDGVKLLRTVIPETFESDDPVRFRHMIIRIHVDEVTGRSMEMPGR
jgi:nitroimidazol reductase NimA-like FMN-containing flavoprotein (pyridoxamine 5'-phosphate oxidase superfamily)